MRTVKTNLTREAAQVRVTTLFSGDMIGAIEHFNLYTALSHSISVMRGWHKEGERNVGELFALMHSEISEALEGARKDLPSDHIQGFTMVEEEMADLLHRVFDFAGATNMRLGEAFIAKAKFNTTREDHSDEAREDGGKQF